MRIAVLTLTRDRLAYTKHCFTALRAEAGCDFDHYVLDQGSTDGTADWLYDEFKDGRVTGLAPSLQNLGISRGMNRLIDGLSDDYDVIVKFDNDCELTQPNTLRDICQLIIDNDGALLSPRILGLKNPPQPTREVSMGGETILDIPQIGGIFLAAPAWVYDDFRYSPDNPYWGMDDVQICAWFRQQGGICGYVDRLEAWHYEGTVQQEQRFPEYLQRKQLEMA